MTAPSYAGARAAAAKVRPRFADLMEREATAALPNAATMEELIDTAFWASLRREEGYSPKISLAYLPPDRAGAALVFESPLRLAPETLVRLAPAVERPGIHLGVWHNSDGLRVWGATRAIPAYCFILQAVAPGLLVIKHRRGETAGKFVNIAVLEGDQIKVVDRETASLPGCPNVVMGLLGFDCGVAEDAVNVLVELSVSMRAHGRGGALLLVPSGSEEWRKSMIHPIHYAVSPPFTKLAELMGRAEEGRSDQRWLESFRRAIDWIAGLTSVDGATVMTDAFEVLAFGVKIRRREGASQVEQVILTEPIEGAVAQRLASVQTGGTRHLSAAQFGHDQHDAVALVASQDGRFTVFSWSPCEDMVHAHRIETLLL